MTRFVTILEAGEGPLAALCCSRRRRVARVEGHTHSGLFSSCYHCCYTGPNLIAFSNPDYLSVVSSASANCLSIGAKFSARELLGDSAKHT